MSSKRPFIQLSQYCVEENRLQTNRQTLPPSIHATLFICCDKITVLPKHLTLKIPQVTHTFVCMKSEHNWRNSAPSWGPCVSNKRTLHLPSTGAFNGTWSKTTHSTFTVGISKNVPLFWVLCSPLSDVHTSASDQALPAAEPLCQLKRSQRYTDAPWQIWMEWV